MIAYPEFLPEPQRDGYGFQPVSPMARSELQSGRARQRRRFTSVPTVASVTWLMDDGEAQLFEGWFEHILLSGSLWFQCPLKTPLGMDEHRARFVDIYEGPILVGESFGALPRSWSCSNGRFWMPSGSLMPRTTSQWLASSISP